jgi:tRNA A-37 threonylcarbamoyl transferase component Bud32
MGAQGGMRWGRSPLRKENGRHLFFFASILLILISLLASKIPQCAATAVTMDEGAGVGSDEADTTEGDWGHGSGGAAAAPYVRNPKMNPLVKVYNTTVYWYGGNNGKVSCEGCMRDNPNITFLAPDYACSMERHQPPASPGNWNNGTNEFFVGVDPSRIITQVNLTMHGRFRCPMGAMNAPPTILNILVESAAITQEPIDYTACLNCPYCASCDACMTNITVVGTEFEEWPTMWNYEANNTIHVRVLSGMVCLHSIDIFVETVPAHIPITSTITTLTTGNVTTTGGGGDKDREFRMPIWGYALIGASGFFCFASIVIWMTYVVTKRVRRRMRRYGSIQDDDDVEKRSGCCDCLGPVVDTETESDYGDDYDYSRRPRSIYASIDVNEVGEDTKRLLGIPAGGDLSGSAERKALLKISHKRGKLRASGQHNHHHHRKDSSGQRGRRHKKSSQEGMVKQMDYGEIVLGERVGKGSYGEVFKGTWRGTEVAVKKLPYYFEQLEDREQQKTFLEGFIQETQLMKTLHHPNVIQLFASFTHPEVMIVMEFMARGSLYQILHDKSVDLSWDLRRQILLDAARGMTYLHKSQPVIVHRDLKSHNLLVGEHWRCKVSDFGLSRMLTAMDTMTSCGTPSWTAPEVLRGEKYTEKCDVYSFGIVLWECVTRMTPHEGIPHFQVVFQVGTQGLRPEIPGDTPHHWGRLTADCWAEDPDARPSFEEILDRLQKF